MHEKKPEPKPARRSVFPRLLAAVGVLLGIAAAIVFVALPDDVVGDVASVEESLDDITEQFTPLPSSPDSTPPAPEPVETASETPRYEPNQVSRLEDLAPDETPIPVRLRIEDIGIDAPVVPHGIEERTGQMDVPYNTRDVAWYEYGPRPGQRGSAVLAAHVDLAGRGPGVFFDLKALQPGDRVEVVYEDGSEMWFEVKARATYQKDELPLDTIFSREGAPVLTLITCGGGFSRSLQSYDSNVVVYASPVQGSSTPAPVYS